VSSNLEFWIFEILREAQYLQPLETLFAELPNEVTTLELLAHTKTDPTSEYAFPTAHTGYLRVAHYFSLLLPVGA
jgi:hypothetical protein